MYNKLIQLYKAIKFMRGDKFTVQRAIKQHADYLKPGWYIFNGTSAYRCFSDLPLSIKKETKSGKRLEVRFLKLRFIYRIVEYVVPPLGLIYINKQYKLTASGSLLLLRSKSLKIFDFKNKTVYTWRSSELESENIYKSYKLFSKYFSIPSIKIMDDKVGLEEEYINGLTFSQISKSERLNFFFKLVDGYKKLINSSVYERYAIMRIEDLLSSVEKNSRSRHLLIAVKNRAELVNKILNESVWIWSHGNLHPNNLLIKRDKIYVIDLESICRRPFFYDLFALAVREQINGNDALVHAINNGSFDSFFHYAFGQFKLSFNFNLSDMWLSHALIECYDHPDLIKHYSTKFNFN